MFRPFRAAMLQHRNPGRCLGLSCARLSASSSEFGLKTAGKRRWMRKSLRFRWIGRSVRCKRGWFEVEEWPFARKRWEVEVEERAFACKWRGAEFEAGAVARKWGWFDFANGSFARKGFGRKVGVVRSACLSQCAGWVEEWFGGALGTDVPYHLVTEALLAVAIRVRAVLA